MEAHPTEAPAGGGRSRYVRRFNLFARVSHIALMVAFLGLAGTGLPLLFSQARWAYWLSRFWGGYAAAAALHRFFGMILIVTFAAHVGRLAYRVIVRRDRTILWGPTSMVPQLRDLKDLYNNMKYFVGLGPRPKFDHFAYWEKFDYWAVFWGMFIIGGSGVMLWFPTFFAHLVPGWVLNIAELIHGEEALLAVGFIFTVHFFNTHLRPGAFPMDIVIFTGRMPRHELENDRSDEAVRLGAAGKLEELDALPPTPELVLTARVIGTIAIVFGLAMVGLILYAVLSH